MKRTLLIVDDEEAVLHSLIRMFRGEGYTLLTANSGEAALRLLAQNDVQVILADQRMPGMSGVELLFRAKELYPDTVRMVLSGYADIMVIADAVNRGNVFRFLFKPWDNDLLRANVREAFERFDLSQQSIHFSKIFENSMEGVLITDQNAVIQAVNPAFSSITGYQPAEVIGHTPAMLKSGQHGEEFYQEMWAILREKGKWAGEVWNRRKNGETYPEWLNITPIRDSQGNVTQYVGLFSDITERKRNEERLRHHAFHDALTNLPNRLLLSENLELAVSQAERSGQQVAVLMLDLDNFKYVNDTFGHDFGDRLLLAVTERIKGVIRKGDTLARMGGDEFSLLLPQVRDANEAVAVIEKLFGEMNLPFSVGKNELKVTASIGISFYPQDGANSEELLKSVGSALARAKEEGGNTYVFFTQEMTERAKERMVVENDLSRAVQAGEIEVFFQPKLKLGEEAIVGMEALARWNHPARGRLLPKDFMAVAEETGLIVGLGKWILEEACRWAALWQRRGLGNLQVAVNLSSRQFLDVELLDTITDILDRTGLDPRFLELELAESLVMGNAQMSTERLVMLKRLGVSLAVDNFGTGYSSLSYLKRLPVDALKIDQSFVRDVASDPHSAELVRTLIGMAHNFKLEVVAEGVETAEQMDFLRHNGCDLIQGFLLARPMAATEFEAFLAERVSG